MRSEQVGWLEKDMEERIKRSWYDFMPMDYCGRIVYNL